MAPRDTPKETPKVQRTLANSRATKKPLPSTTTTSSTLKRRISIRKTTQQTPFKANNTVTMDSRQRTNTLPPPVTPRKENNPAPVPGSVTKSAKKSWKRRPKPAHSGVPVPEKMKKILQQQLRDYDCL